MSPSLVAPGAFVAMCAVAAAMNGWLLQRLPSCVCDGQCFLCGFSVFFLNVCSGKSRMHQKMSRSFRDVGKRLEHKLGHQKMSTAF